MRDIDELRYRSLESMQLGRTTEEIEKYRKIKAEVNV